ncbi:MAG: aminotransferase class V-fold PLP-dependent enzyme [Patescibacteria group bacterium]
MKQQRFFTAGPSQYYHTVPQHMQNAIKNQVMSISHRGAAFAKIYDEAVHQVRTVMEAPDDSYVFFFSSATEIWERLLENCVEQKASFFVNGVFGERFYWAGEMLKKDVTKIEASFGETFDFEQTELPDNTELIGFTHNESSSGVMLNMDRVYTICERYPEALIALDVVSSAPYTKIDYGRIDAVYFSVQKGFGLPAGLGVCILSRRAFEKSRILHEKGAMVGTYHSFQQMQTYAEKKQTVETPNVMNMYLLGKVIPDIISDYGNLETFRKQINDRAQMLYDFFDTHTSLRPFVKHLSSRSATLAVIETGGESEQIITMLRERGIEVGYGYGKWRNEHIRIANFPAHTTEDISNLLTAMAEYGR